LSLMTKHDGCSSMMRRPSLHEKDAMSAKDAKEEARHVLEMMAVSQNDDDDDDNDESVQPDIVQVSGLQLFITVGLVSRGFWCFIISSNKTALISVATVDRGCWNSFTPRCSLASQADNSVVVVVVVCIRSHNWSARQRHYRLQSVV